MMAVVPIVLTLWFTLAMRFCICFPSPKYVLKFQDHTASEIFSGKKVVICGVPGAFTPTCSDDHLPSFIALADEMKVSGR